MKKIYKYPLKFNDDESVLMPKGAEILCAQMQYGTLCLWALVDPSAELEPRQIEIYGTGNPVEPGHRHYISTVQLSGGDLVFHVFEKP